MGQMNKTDRDSQWAQNYQETCQHGVQEIHCLAGSAASTSFLATGGGKEERSPASSLVFLNSEFQCRCKNLEKMDLDVRKRA
jgi:hypothetical protein